jgi:hypothetical protein
MLLMFEEERKESFSSSAILEGVPIVVAVDFLCKRKINRARGDACTRVYYQYYDHFVSLSLFYNVTILVMKMLRVYIYDPRAKLATSKIRSLSFDFKTRQHQSHNFRPVRAENLRPNLRHERLESIPHSRV